MQVDIFIVFRPDDIVVMVSFVNEGYDVTADAFLGLCIIAQGS